MNNMTIKEKFVLISTMIVFAVLLILTSPSIALLPASTISFTLLYLGIGVTLIS